MNLDEKYQAVISALKSENRAMVKLNAEDTLELVNLWKNSILDHQQNHGQTNQLKKIICVASYSQKMMPELQEYILLAMELKNLSNDIIIFLLTCGQKHIIDYYKLQGHKLPQPYLKALSKLFTAKEDDVLFWLLKSVQSIGRQNVYFKKEVANIKLGVLDIFSSKKRSIVTLIDELAKEWEKIPHQ